MGQGGSAGPGPPNAPAQRPLRPEGAAGGVSPGVHRAHAAPEGQAPLGPAPEDKAALGCRVFFSGRARQQVGRACGLAALAASVAIRRPDAR